MFDMFYRGGVGDGQNFSFIRTPEGRMDGMTHRSTYRGGAHLKME